MREPAGSASNLTYSYAAADTIMRNRATSFYHAFGFLPRERFRGIAAVYAFCRTADDVVDSDTEGSRRVEVLAELDGLERLLRSLYERETEVPASGYPWWRAFADTTTRFGIPKESFVQQLDGQRSDADFHDLQTVDSLLHYSRLVAGSVGIMMMPLLAADGVDSHEPAFVLACENLGVGMQITNILRDVGEDLRTRNRLYLPASLLEQYGVSRDELAALARADKLASSEIPREFIRLWEALAGMADTYYENYVDWLGHFQPAARVPLAAAALSYRAIADVVRREHYNCFTKRCYTSSAERAALLFRAQRLVAKHAGKA